jgi:hypothetical protein
MHGSAEIVESLLTFSAQLDVLVEKAAALCADNTNTVHVWVTSRGRNRAILLQCTVKYRYNACQVTVGPLSVNERPLYGEDYLFKTYVKSTR